MCGSGVMRTAPFTSLIGFRQASVLPPSMFIAQEPQIPSRQDRRKVRVGSTSIFTWRGLTIDVSPMPDPDDQNDQRLVPQLTDDAIIPHTIPPQANKTVPQRLSEQSRTVGSRDPGFEVFENFPADFPAQAIEVVDRARIVFNPPGQEPGAPERSSGIAGDC